MIRSGQGRGKRGEGRGRGQQQLPFETSKQAASSKGRRRKRGRPPLPHRKGVAHRARPAHSARHPVHVTLRARRRLPTLRAQSLFLEVRRALGEASHDGYRIVHFSVQADHIHLVVEAPDKTRLSRGTSGLTIRIARAINRMLTRRGRVFSDRYHARALKTPREVRNAIVYVLQNWKKHQPNAKGIDRCSSGWWFTGWKVPPGVGPPRWKATEPAPVVPSRTWLGETGWTRYGSIDSTEKPRSE